MDGGVHGVCVEGKSVRRDVVVAEINEMSADPVLAAEEVIDARRTLVHILRVVEYDAVVVASKRGSSWSRIVGLCSVCELGDPASRNLIVRKRQPGERIRDRTETGKIAAEHGGGGHAGKSRSASMDPLALVVQEVEQLVVLDRPAHAPAELVLASWGLPARQV